VSPNARERAYERRRYEEWQAKLAARKAARRRARMLSLSIGAAVLVILVVGGTFFLVSRNNKTDTAAASPSATPNATATAAATQAAGGCPPSTLPAIENPKQYKLPSKSLAGGKTWTLTLETTCGQIVIELDGKKAPQAVSSTIALSRDGFYDKTPCPRLVTSGIFVLQCGDPTGTTGGTPGYTYGPLENVPKDGIYAAGDVAIARGATADSQGSQFFLVYKQTSLPPEQTGGGYTLVGHITKGLDVIEKLATTGDDGSNSAGGGKPNTPFSILSAKVSAG
jgi:peptidyl-prolyl cis-trans isomerase B (cyclophilin B)